jgi:hypothetical protein
MRWLWWLLTLEGRFVMCWILSFHFLMKYKNKKSHNMTSLMLDPRFKNLHIISSFVEWDQNVSFVEEYDKKSLYPMLVKCHEHLHLLIRLDRNYVNQNVLIRIVVCTFLNKVQVQATKKLVKREWLIFKWYQLDVKNIKCPFQW